MTTPPTDTWVTITFQGDVLNSLNAAEAALLIAAVGNVDPDSTIIPDAVMEALQKALEFAESRRHTELSENHLLHALFADEQGYFAMFATSVGLEVAPLLKSLEHALDSAAQYTGEPQKPNISLALQKRISEAQEIAKKWQDLPLKLHNKQK